MRIFGIIICNSITENHLNIIRQYKGIVLHYISCCEYSEKYDLEL
jgi:hypothetical protein